MQEQEQSDVRGTFVPKKAGPDHWVPVISLAILESEEVLVNTVLAVDLMDFPAPHADQPRAGLRAGGLRDRALPLPTKVQSDALQALACTVR